MITDISERDEIIRAFAKAKLGDGTKRGTIGKRRLADISTDDLKRNPIALFLTGTQLEIHVADSNRVFFYRGVLAHEEHNPALSMWLRVLHDRLE